MSLIRSKPFRFTIITEWILILFFMLIFVHPVICQETNPSSTYGIFEHSADWGTDEYPPKLGTYKIPGKVELREENGLVYNVYGNGDDIWGATDEGFFLYTTRSGSWSLSAKVEWIFNGRDMYVFVGYRPNASLHIRANPEDSSSMDYRAYLRTGGYGPHFGEIYSAWRPSHLAQTYEYKVLDEQNNTIRDKGDGVYLRITRIAPENLFFTSWSPDGIHWQIVHQLHLLMPEKTAYGLSITNAEDNELLAQAQFKHVNIEPAPPIATRYLSSHTYRPFDYIKVILSVLNPHSQTQPVQIQETLPKHWAMLDASFHPIHNEEKLIWNLNAEPGYTQIHYTIQAPDRFEDMAVLHGTILDTPIFGNNALLDSVTNLESFRTHIFFRTVFLITPLVMGLIHLFLFIFLPKLKENLYYSFFLFGIALHVSLATSQTTSLDELEIVWYQGAILAAFYISMLMLSLSSLVFNQLPAFFWWYFVIALTLAALVHTTGHLVFLVTHNIVYTLGLLNATRIAFQGLWRNKTGFSIIVLGMILYNFAWWWLYIETAFHIIDPPFYIMPFSMLALIFAMSIYLSYWFSHLYRNMESLTGELEARVAARTQDITNANVRLNETIVQLAHAKEEAETANKAKSQFLARMSHEIRTPLTGLLGISDFLQNTPLNSQQSSLLKSLHIAGNSLLNIINEILDFSKIETDMLVLELSEMNLYETVRESVESLQVLADNKFIQLHWSYPEKLPHRVVGDPYRIRQLLTNLTGNAIKFTKIGSVTVSVNGTLMKDERIRFAFCVKDTGIGIPPESQDQIFEAFSQGDETTTRRFGGTGLGLSIVKRIVELMDGTVHVESVVNKGSTFRVQIPLMPLFDKDEPASQEQPMPAVRFQARILLAEDDPVISHVTQEMLHYYGCEFVHTTNGLDAVRAFQQDSFDLVLMDYHMPELDGIEAAIAIRNYEREKGISKTVPILAVTANISNETHEKCLQSGIQSVLQKPFRMEELVTVLKEWIPNFQSASIPTNLFRSHHHVPQASPAVNPLRFEQEPVFDPIPLEQVQTIQQPGSNLVGKVIVKFFEDSERSLQKLNEAFDRKQINDIHLWAHRMVGSNVTIGGARLAAICRTIEESGDLQLMQELVTVAEREYHTLVDHLKIRFMEELGK